MLMHIVSQLIDGQITVKFMQINITWCVVVSWLASLHTDLHSCIMQELCMVDQCMHKCNNLQVWQ